MKIEYDITFTIKTNNFRTVKRLAEKLANILHSDVIEIDFKTNVKQYLTE